MIKKVFALVSASALAAMVTSLAQTGCSDSSDPLTATDAGTATDARSERSNQPPDLGAKEPPPCYSDNPVQVEPASLKPLRLEPGKCTKENSLDVLDALVAAKLQVSFEELHDAIRDRDAECAKCIFAEDGESRPPVVVDGSGAVVANLPVSDLSCIEAVTSADCARASMTYLNCVDKACQSCSPSNRQDCSKAVGEPESACTTYWSTLLATCGGQPAMEEAFVNICKPIASRLRTLISYQCIGDGTNGDAGADGANGE